MIFHVTDGNFKVLAAITDDVPDGWILQDDDRVEELETGTSTFSFTVGYRFNKSKSDPFSRTNAANIFKAGNHIFKTNNWGAFSSDQVYTIVTSEENFKDGTFTVESEDLGLDLLNDVLPAAEEKSATAKEFMDEALKGTDFIFKINDAQDIPAKALSFSEETVSSRILNIADAFGMRVRYRYEFDNNGFKTDGTNHGKIIDFISKNSENNGTILYMNTDIEDMHVQTDVSDLVTALEVSGTNDVGNSINLSGFTIPDADKSRYVLKGTVLRDTVAYRNYPGYNGRNNEGFLTGIFNYSNQVKNQEELYEAAKKQLIELSSPKVTYEVDLYDNVLYEKNVSVGETVSIVEDDISETYLTAVVQKFEVSELSGTAKITLGDYKIASSGIDEQVQRIANRLQGKLNDLQVYTWIVYADDVSGTNISLEPTYEDSDGVTQFHTYMGVANNRVNMDIDISDPTIFKWSRIQGHKGDDGISYYLHVAYCNRNSDGSYGDFSTTESEGKAYIGTYTDTNPQASEDPTKYNWQLVKGRDADQQVTHFAYANREGGYFEIDNVTGNDDGTIAFTDSNGHTFIDVSVSDSTLIFSKGGEKELYGKIDEERGTLILATPDTLYTDFSTVDNTGRKWLGVCVDKNADAPTTPQSYVWSKVVGDDGTSYSVKVTNEGNGATITVTDSNGNVTSTAFVADGKDGQSIKGDDAYLHVAYAFSSDGKDGFSTTWVKGASYVGLLSNHTEEDSTNYTDYEWSLIKGADGQDGKPGKDGTNGTSNYIHIKYSSSASPTDDQMTEAPDKYIGIAVDTTETDPTTASSYTWSKFKGDDGIKGTPGKDGVNGKTYYVHFAYSTSSDGKENFSTTEFNGAKYMGVMTDENEVDSKVYTAYAWSLIKGADGHSPKVTATKSGDTTTIYVDDEEQATIKDGKKGDKGDPGADGVSTYTHVAYANREGGYFEIDNVTGNDDGTIAFTDSNGHTFIDVSVSDSTLIFSKGGEKELYGKIDEERGTLILATPDTLYTDFSTVDNTGRKWLGVCVDKNADAPTTPQSYVWSKVVGDDGTSYSVKVTNEGNGATITVTDSNGNVTSTAFVADGKDGQSIKGDDAYLHVAYAFSSDGKDGFSTTWVKGASYVGLLSNHTEEDSTNYTDYEWSLIKGADGQDGKPGKDGTNGTSNYIHIKYSSSASPTDDQMTEAPDKYIGIAVDTTETDPTTASSYTWSKFKGDDGIKGTPGKDGVNGKTYYVHFAYSTSSDGKENFSTTEFNGAKYMGVMTDENEVDSKVYTAYAWSLIKGADGHSPKVTATKSGDTTTIYVDDEEQATIKDGKKGDKGDPGADGVSTYTHVAYANRKNALTPQNAVQSITGNDNGVITFSSVDGSNKYYVPVVSDDGVLSFNESDIPITVKVSGDTLVFSSAELIDFSLTDPTGRDYIGTLTDHNETASTNPYAYTWVRVKGKGISSYSQEFYLSSSDKTISGGEWALDMPERKDGYYYWVRYHTVYDDDTEVYSDPHLLTDLNEVWGVVRKNTSDISKQGSEINLHSQSISYAQSVADQAKAKADANESNIANNTEGLTAIRKQTSDLQTNYDNITGTVTDNQEAIGALQTAIAQLTTLGFTVATSNYDTQSTIDGHGIMVYDKSKCPTDSDGKVTSIPNEAIIAQFTSGQSLIQSVKIITAIIMGHHNIETVNAKEWDNTAAYGTFKEESSESAGTGFMYTGS